MNGAEEEEKEIATYEDVARLYPQPRTFRPVVLFGPSGVGCNELKRRLIAMDPEKYRTTVPCECEYFLCRRELLSENVVECVSLTLW